MIIGIMAVTLDCIHSPYRILHTMALQRILPSFLAKVDEMGWPRWALAVTAALAATLTYRNLSGKRSI